MTPKFKFWTIFITLRKLSDVKNCQRIEIVTQIWNIKKVLRFCYHLVDQCTDWCNTEKHLVIDNDHIAIIRLSVDTKKK